MRARCRKNSTLDIDGAGAVSMVITQATVARSLALGAEHLVETVGRPPVATRNGTRGR